MPPKVKLESDSHTAPAKRVRKQVEKGTEEYMLKRERNNVAVKKSRERSRAKAAETQIKVQRLKNENAQLEQKVELLQKELSVLKDLFLAHAGAMRQPELTTGGSTDAATDTASLEGGGVMANQKAIKNDHEYTTSVMSWLTVTWPLELSQNSAKATLILWTVMLDASWDSCRALCTLAQCAALWCIFIELLVKYTVVNLAIVCLKGST